MCDNHNITLHRTYCHCRCVVQVLVCDNHNITLHRTYCHCRCVVQVFAVVILFFNYFGLSFFNAEDLFTVIPLQTCVHCDSTNTVTKRYLLTHQRRIQTFPWEDPGFFLENNWISKQLVLRKIKSENYKTW